MIAASDLPEVLPCGRGNCRAEFKGEYRKGNRARHWRVRHGGSDGSAKNFECEDTSCNKTFYRSDARLNHYRKQHPSLASPPQTRKPLAPDLSLDQTLSGNMSASSDADGTRNLRNDNHIV